MDRLELWNKYLREEFTDLDIIINDGYQDNVFKCHKVVLSSAAGYFGHLFQSGMKESKEAEMKLRINLPKEVFESVLHYIYTGNIVSIKNLSLLLDILKSATYFQLPDLEESVESEIKDLSLNEVIELIGQLVNSHLLYFPRLLIDKIVQYFQDLLKIQEIMMIPFQAMYSLLCSEKLQIKDEESLLSFVIKYISLNQNLTLPKIRALGKTIQWEHIKPSTIQEIGTDIIQQLIDENELYACLREFEDRITIFPENYFIALFLTEVNSKKVKKIAHRYLSAKNLYFSMNISQETCSKMHLVLKNWPENGRFESHNFSFNISFEEGYIGSFFNISFKIRRLVGCEDVHISYKSMDQHKNSIKIPLNQDINITQIDQELITGGFMECLGVSVTGGRKPHAHITEAIIEGCVYHMY